MTYTTLTKIAHRWQVDPATARMALERAAILPCEFFASPRYSWDEVLEKIEAWPTPVLDRIDCETRLEKAEVLADHFGVTTQTIRNYGRSGRLHRIEITPRAVRYGSLDIARSESEKKIDDRPQK